MALVILFPVKLIVSKGPLGPKASIRSTSPKVATRSSSSASRMLGSSQCPRGFALIDDICARARRSHQSALEGRRGDCPALVPRDTAGPQPVNSPHAFSGAVLLWMNVIKQRRMKRALTSVE